MTEQLLVRSAPIIASDTDTETNARTLTVQLLRWDDPRMVSDGGRPYTETWARDALVPLDRLAVWDAHQGQLVGHMDAPTDAGHGPVAHVHVARGNSYADNVLALIDSGAIRDVSIEFRPEPDGEVWNADRSEVTRTRAVLRGVAFTIQGAHDAPILQREGTPMPDEPTQPIEITAPPAPEPDRPPLVRADAVTDELVALRSELVAMRDRPTLGGLARHPGAEWASMAEYTDARFERSAEVPALLCRALVDQITTNNPGVIPPGWLDTVFGIVDRGRPLINAFGLRSAPAEGMDINWPYFDGNLTALVGEQLTQKAAITSVRVDLKRGTEVLRTFAGGSDISYQLIRRSSPSYRDAYMRIMMAAYAAETEAAAGSDAVAAATAGPVWVPGTGTAADLREALFGASAAVQAATGSPASFAVAATDVFTAIGSLDGLWPAPYGTSNASGTADAGSLTVNVSGLPVVHGHQLPPGTLLVSNGEAAAWLEDGPFTVTAEDVEKLGQNVAVWGMGAWATFLPAGLVKIPAA